MLGKLATWRQIAWAVTSGVSPARRPRIVSEMSARSRTSFVKRSADCRSRVTSRWTDTKLATAPDESRTGEMTASSVKRAPSLRRLTRSPIQGEPIASAAHIAS